jgi:hypothetical protein
MFSIDKSTRYTCYTAGRMGGWLSANMVLEAEGMEPIKGGDEFLVPLNTVPASQAVDNVETEDSPEDAAPSQPTATRAKEMYQPIFADAFSRLQHRSKRDLETITNTLSPLISSLGAYFRTSSTVGTAEAEAVSKYLKGLESRVSKLDGGATEVEMSKLTKALVFAIEADKAETKAKEILSHE